MFLRMQVGRLIAATKPEQSVSRSVMVVKTESQAVDGIGQKAQQELGLDEDHAFHTQLLEYVEDEVWVGLWAILYCFHGFRFRAVDVLLASLWSHVLWFIAAQKGRSPGTCSDNCLQYCQQTFSTNEIGNIRTHYYPLVPGIVFRGRGVPGAECYEGMMFSGHCAPWALGHSIPDTEFQGHTSTCTVFRKA